MDVLEMIDGLRARLWNKHGDVLEKEYSQDEIHMTYYIGELLKRRGFVWFKSVGKDGACYTEKAMHAAFIAGQRIGEKNASAIADAIVEERLYQAHQALSGNQ